MHTNPLAADPHPRIAEVDLHLMSRRGLVAHRPALPRLQFPPPTPNPKLHGRSPMKIPRSLASSWRATSALPSWRRKRSRCHALSITTNAVP